jgi:hypothetical protein
MQTGFYRKLNNKSTSRECFSGPLKAIARVNFYVRSDAIVTMVSSVTVDTVERNPALQILLYYT